MKVEILYRPSYSVAQVFLERNEKIDVEAGAMLAMSADMEIKTNTMRVLNSRRTVMELILSDHPADCLICAKSGKASSLSTRLWSPLPQSILLASSGLSHS